MKKIAMKRIALTTFACLMALPVSAEEINRSIDAAADGHVHVSNIAGSVTVEGWSRSKVEVTGTLGRNVKELIVVRKGDKVVVKVKVPRSSGRGTDSDLHIMVPEKSSLDVGTVSADIEVSGVLGEQDLQSVSGDVEAECAGGYMTAESVSGDVDITGDGEDGEVSASAVSGDVNLTRISGVVSLEAVSGDLTIHEGSFRRADVSSVTGEIVFSGELLEDGKLSVESVNGDVDIELQDNVSARFEIDTFNGDIDNCFGPEAERSSAYAPGWELEFEVGGGDGRVEISTLNGDIALCND